MSDVIVRPHKMKTEGFICCCGCKSTYDNAPNMVTIHGEAGLWLIASHLKGKEIVIPREKDDGRDAKAEFAMTRDLEAEAERRHADSL